MSFFKGKIKEKHVVRKEFSFNKDNVALNFTLRTDIDDELRKFKELLEKALETVNNELKK